MTRPYDVLIERLREISDLRGIEALLGWDQQTYMPSKGNNARARQMALLTSLGHQKFTSPELGELLDGLAADGKLKEEEKAQLRETKRDRDRAVKLPNELVKELSECAAQAHTVWVEARAKRDFAHFAPILGKLIALKKREAEALGYEAGGTSYDALLDQFEPGASVRSLDPLLSRTRDIIVPAVKAIAQAPKKAPREIMEREYPAKKQAALGLAILKRMHFDFEAGRLDETVHPFTTNFDIDDVRITTKYETNWLPAAIFSIVHEGGHALYEMGLPRKLAGTPLGEARSLGIHESQSRFWENMIGRSLPFWTYFYPKAKRLFPKALDGVSLEDFHFAINAVVPSLIRIEADEVTYNLHIIVRYEVEKALFVEGLPLKDAPALWNELYKKYLGVEVPHDGDGILQDVHWSFGGFGYFPTYLLGNLYAAQWLDAMRKEYPDFDTRVAKGDLKFILSWLRRNIHSQGRRHSSEELARRASGEALNPDHFAVYLKTRFGGLYGVKW